MSKSLLILSLMISVLLFGCASTNQAKTAISATITEKHAKLSSSSSHWGINKLVQVGDTKLGYYAPHGVRITEGNRSINYIVDAGSTAILARYYDNQTGNHLVNQTPITKMQVNLKAQRRYELRSVKENGELQFMVVDLDGNEIVATSDWVRLSQQPLPEAPGELGTLVVPGLLRLFR